MPATQSRAALVHDSIRADIVSGALMPGTPLRLAPLAAKHDVSMSVLREALTRLAEHNLATLSPNQGFRVVEISRSDLIELTELRTNLEGLALTQSITAGDVAWEARVVSAHHVLAKVTIPRQDGFGSTDEWSEAHTAFHEALVSACENRRLLAITASLRNSSELYRQLSALPADEEQRDLVTEHEQLMVLATSRRVADAHAALVQHITRTTEVVLATTLRTTPL
ncbi:GntR family transcriptional regulator [Subtercola lobariae]|uniref:GntR family transcriptional regulator n=1 Tax=Subtercola lobariae TaxID=1588641 RepID=A0A917EWF3_9MICO|nr:GntR family transcriptional regulator [Subtercola lobariae]